MTLVNILCDKATAEIIAVMFCIPNYNHNLFCLYHFSVAGPTGLYIKVLFCTSLFFVLGHVCFQMMLYTYPPLYTALADNCTQWDVLSKHIGLSRYKGPLSFGFTLPAFADVNV